MKYRWIIPVNILIVTMIIAFIAVYARSRQQSEIRSKEKTFVDLTLAMERVMENYFVQEQHHCDSWATYINSSGLSLRDAALTLQKSHTGREDGAAHIILAGQLEGLAVENGRICDVSYKGISLLRDPDELHEIGEHVNITRTFTDPVSGIQSLAFYNKVLIREDLEEKEAYLMHLVQASAVDAKWVFPAQDFEKAEISLIDENGDYIIRGRSFKNTNFYEFYKSYNETDADRLKSLKDTMTGIGGSFYMNDSRKERCLIVHSVVDTAKGWTMIAYLPGEALAKAVVDWRLILAVVISLLLLLVIDLAVMLHFNRALERSALAAQSASESKSAFVSNMSHEIRTPITAILGMNEMIRRESTDENVLEYSNNIQNAGANLLAIINDILDFSKIESGRMEIVESEYALDSMIGDIINMLQMRADAKDLTFTTIVDPTLPIRLVGDELRLKQVIINLLTNAVKYTEKGGVTFELKKLDLSEDLLTMEISVSDTGIGIRKEEMEKLFSAFDRLDTKRTRTIEGTGLGLAITHRILDIMGSQIRVESEYEKGSKFWFVIRQKVADASQIGEFDPMAYAYRSVHEDRKQSSFVAPGVRLLVVDDTPLNLQVITGLLRRTKMDIDSAYSGEECIELFKENDYDLIFLDYRMPRMDGVETLKELRRRYPNKYKRTPVICLTANAISGEKEKMIAAGFDDYLTKPVNVADMEGLIIKFLKDRVHITRDDMEKDEEYAGDKDLSTAGDKGSTLPADLFKIDGLIVQNGIDYCGDEEDYLEVLKVYNESADEKASAIRDASGKEDLASFTLLTHSLKSTSAAIGAVRLKEAAFALEKAGKENDRETILRDTPGLIEEYEALQEALSKILKA